MAGSAVGGLTGGVIGGLNANALGFSSFGKGFLFGFGIGASVGGFAGAFAGPTATGGACTLAMGWAVPLLMLLTPEIIDVMQSTYDIFYYNLKAAPGYKLDGAPPNGIYQRQSPPPQTNGAQQSMTC